MLNARHRFTVLWQRLIAALSLVMAAALAPAATPAPGAGAIGSGMGSGAPVASAANALAANVAAVIGGGQQQLPLDTSPDGTKAKACVVPLWHDTAPLQPLAAGPPLDQRTLPATHAPRSGDARAPPLA